MRALIVALLLAVGTKASAQEVRSVFRGADPGALFIGKTLWVDPTGNGDTLDAWSSDDLKAFKRQGRLISLKDITWAGTDRQRTHFLWAPQMVVRPDGRTLLYFSVGPQNPTPSRLASRFARRRRARAPTAAGRC